MNLSKSIDFLLDNAGPVIQYRLRKEILGNIIKTEKENLLEQIYQTPYFKLVESYVKPNGYIGVGMHSWSNWRGVSYHETPLQDAETAGRLLAYYAVPKNHPYVRNFVKAMRDDDIMREEFSYVPPAKEVFNIRFAALNSGFCLGVLLYTLQTLLGYGDDYEDLREYQQICIKGFERILEIDSIEDITKFKPELKRKYNRPYIEADEYFPCSYSLTMLAHSQNWRNTDRVDMLAKSLNRINEIMKPDTEMFIRVNGKYVAPAFAFCVPLRAFRADLIDTILYRRVLTEIAMLGVGDKVGILRESAANIEEAIDKDGILRLDFSVPHNKRYSPKKLEYPGAYSDVRLEPDYKKNKNALLCDLTFWAVQFMHLYKQV